MIVDSSALVALLRAEPDAAVYAQSLAAAERVRLSAANFVETAAVINGGRDPIASRRSGSSPGRMSAAQREWPGIG